MNPNARAISSLPHHVYRVYGPEAALLYVGISNNYFTRMKYHEKYAIWSEFIRFVVVEQLIDRRAAMAEESRAIREDKPIFNVTNENAWGCELSSIRLDCFMGWLREDGWEYLDVINYG